MTLNVCRAGHETHVSKLVDSHFGPWWIWDWERYAGFPNYCTGQCEVSKSIDVNGIWEPDDTNRMLAILTEQPGLVLDFGSHIGWFAVQAAEKGCDVETWDADPETQRLLAENYDRRHRQGMGDIGGTVCWAADLEPEMFDYDHVRFLKADVEGHEWEMVRATRRLWEDRLIDYALLEISPIFENRDAIQAPSYAELVDELRAFGYKATVHKTEGPWEITGMDCTFDQENVLFSKL